jgi:hypothetical protein
MPHFDQETTKKALDACVDALTGHEEMVLKPPTSGSPNAPVFGNNCDIQLRCQLRLEREPILVKHVIAVLKALSED